MEVSTLILLVYLLSSYLISYLVIIKVASDIEVTPLVFAVCIFIFLTAPMTPFAGFGALIGYVLSQYFIIPILKVIDGI